ncbi:hypothetical protein [Pseudoalteromonas sp. NZS100]|uniref:hypothetical protein n=1 Tax=Pseudoalteromonas sp. NZS100 TaxID=2792046 RepID=UPI0018CCBC1D|nr:hypothetical protein [Pseudoalteromonas sp. NZS100]MBH0070185.1 hypothetical protein [Pseudoalteromonas sp. NZS100]
MRVDTRLERQGLTNSQIFFIECWLSLTSKSNIDSDRVTFNNSLNAVEELLSLYKLGTKYRAPQKRLIIAEELISIFKSDTCLDNPTFKNIPNHLIEILSANIPSESEKNQPIEKEKKLIVSLLNQLKTLIEKNYRDIALYKIDELINNENEADFDKLYVATNNLASTLNSLGMPLTECYLLGRNFFLSRNESFIEQFAKFKAKLTLQEEDVRVSLKIISNKLYTFLDGIEGELNFNNCRFHLIDHQKRNSIAVNITVCAISHSAAHSKSLQVLHRSLDIMAVAIGQDKIIIQRSYDADGWGISKTIRDSTDNLISISDRIQSSDFLLYMKTMERVYSEGSDEAIKKVSSAMRFMKKGLEPGASESRFTAFWSALESITEGVSEETLGHDEHVLFATMPCIGLDYPIKQLFALRGVAKELEWGELTLDNNRLDLKTANLVDLYKAIKNEQIKVQIRANLEKYPYAKHRFNKLMHFCNKPYLLGEKVQQHMKKVELQIHRIYRTRNSIVHNAHTPERLELLLVNVEHYLRGTLNAMVYMMENAQTIVTPEEAFSRYKYLTNKIIGEMDPTYLMRSTSTKEKKEKENREKALRSGDEETTDIELVKWLEIHE